MGQELLLFMLAELVLEKKEQELDVLAAWPKKFRGRFLQYTKILQLNYNSRLTNKKY
ncbi:MAG: hypothetical protein ACJATQ_000154 [Cellvibrionaceae bacterium]